MGSVHFSTSPRSFEATHNVDDLHSLFSFHLHQPFAVFLVSKNDCGQSSDLATDKGAPLPRLCFSKQIAAVVIDNSKKRNFSDEN
jgi:hypothetical protein